MYLKSLVLKGFKSFADRSALTLEPGITAVVGPNGSGKSNISDAVLWVLGERNAKNLRGQAMEDVIFAGSSARKASGLAEVDLVLDNSDGTLPVDFDEVAITRRMYRNGESEYLINGTVARRMDVLDILHDSGLGTGTHSIISQGSLDSILQSKPEDRRALIEEAGGTPELIRAIQSHTSDYNTDLPKPELQMEKILFATEELTGLIGAAIVMRPSKSVMDFNVKSLKKKYKDKRFAAGVSREVIASGAEMLGWELDELFARTIEAMQSFAPDRDTFQPEA